MQTSETAWQINTVLEMFACEYYQFTKYISFPTKAQKYQAASWRSSKKSMGVADPL